jgi:hypothetical protein
MAHTRARKDGDMSLFAFHGSSAVDDAAQ